MTPKKITAREAATEYADLFQDTPDIKRWEEILGGKEALVTIDFIDHLDAQYKLSSGEYEVLAYLIN